MASNNHNDGDDERKDLTSLEDLSEFLHVDDPELDMKFEHSSGAAHAEIKDDSANDESIFDLDALNDPLPESNEVSSFLEEEEVFDSNDGIDFLDSSDSNETLSDTDSIDSLLNDTSSLDSVSEEELQNFVQSELDSGEKNNTDSLFSDDLNENTAEVKDDLFSENEVLENNQQDSSSEKSEFNQENLNEPEPEKVEEVTATHYSMPEETKYEKFEDVKDFAQNFSYGTIESAGNPPFSIILKNIKFEEDSEDILALLKEFGIVDDSNLAENQRALELGSLLIPQISEYTAIIVCHKLRRFDLDISVGLSDEIHPSKSGETNPRGLTKKSQIKQNKEESVQIKDINFNLSDILLTNLNQLEGHQVINYLGIDHAHTIIEEDELDRLNFVFKGTRANTVSPEDEKYFENFKEGFQKIHDELLNEIKTRAFKEGANALLGIQFNMNLISENNKNMYQISCSCTKAFVKRTH